MDSSKAWNVLGLEENPSRRQVEIRFANLTRRIRNGEELDYELIQEAYNHLMGKEKHNNSAGRISLAFRRFMFHYYGWVILIATSVMIVAMIMIPVIFRSYPDLTVSFAGRFGIINQDIMDEVLSGKMPETENIMVEVIYLDDSGDSAEFDSGGRTKLSGLLISKEADILIVDDETFNFIRSDNALMALDDIIKEMNIDIPSESFIYGVDFDSGEKKIFGIRAEDSYLVYRTVYGETKRIITIAAKTEHLDDVKKAIEIIFSYRSE